ncbi:RagB/SusD family nutrient uptake outer membrane protein [Paraflavisolibacter sp. H34]|uniref:RagB/SusD family nutrient uptake outer membrane protein n=1 Tax=Huijunlia imazamoxiresistens TaxID=3127457 RepID=UPI003018789C
MKKTTIHSLLILGLSCSAFFACKKIEAEPKGYLTEDLLWDTTDSTGTVTAFFLNNLYNYIPDGFNRVYGDFLDAASGDAIPSRNNTAVEFYTNGLVSMLNNPDPYWGNSYYGIRQANIFLQNYQKAPLKASMASFKTSWPAEARFIRALLYFELVKRYGGVPLVGDSVFNFTDDLSFKRNTYEECVNYIVSECDAIKNDLYKEQISDQNWGRIPRGAALALKARTLLYAASPLMNGGGIETDPAKKALTGYVTADPARWQKVVDACKELKDLNVYALQTSGASLQANYNTLFLSRRISASANEIILARQSAQNTDLERLNAPTGAFGTITNNEGRTSPTQEFVDAFPMSNGLALTEPGSGYNANNPYANRDPRLAAAVFYNGVTWLKRPVETFEGGLDKPTSGTRVRTKTGYYLKKFLYDASAATTYANQNHNFILFRYAEVLLNNAEALNELDRTEEAVTEIIAIRKRAGIAAGTNNRYGIKGGIAKEEMRNLIRNERRLELAFEEHRFWDVRRWKIADQVLSGPVHGMKITRDAATGALTYQKEPVNTLTWNNKLYHMPVPYSEVVKNPNLVQNEGWH